MRQLVIPSIFTAIDKYSAPLDKMSKNTEASLSRMERNRRKVVNASFDVARKSAVVGSAIIAPLALMANSAVEFEDRMSDVGKTTGLAGKDLEKLGGDILGLSKTTRSSIDDLTSIAEIGGQLGVSGKELVSFTKAADMFNIALGKDFSGGVEEAVSTVGKLKGLFKDTRGLNISESIMRTGSAINELGAVGSGTSANISDFALRMGALDDSLKGSASATLAMGTYLEEMGIDSQIASSGLSNLFVKIAGNLPGFAKQMGISAKEAKALFAQDPGQFVASFSQGLKGMDADKMAETLDKLDVGSLEMKKVLGALSSDQVNQATGLTRLTELYNISSDAMQKNTSLSNEAGKKNQTAAAKMDMMKNNIKSLSIEMGQQLLPVLYDVMNAVMPIVKSFADWIGRNKPLVAQILKIAAVVGGLAVALSAVSFTVGLVAKAMSIYSAITKAWTVITEIAEAVQWAWNAAMLANPIGAIVVAITAGIAAVVALTSAFSSSTAAEKLNAEVKNRVLEKTIDQRIEIDSLFRTLRSAKQGTEEYNSALAKIEQIQPGITKQYDLMNKSIENQDKAQKALIKTLMYKATVEARAEIAKEKMKEALLKSEGGASSDSFTQSVLRFFGGGSDVDKIKKFESAGLMAEAESLLDKNEKAKALDEEKKKVNTEKTKQESNNTMTLNNNTSKTDKVVVDFKNVPAGVSVSGSGLGSIMPNTTGTR